MVKKTLTARDESIKWLRQFLRPGSTVWTVLRHVSRSGMTRHYDLYVIRKGEPLRLTWHVARALEWTYSRSHDVLVVGGCGMDMGFHTVYSLSRALFPKGFIPAKAGYRYGRNGTDPNELDRDGGYALNQRSM